MTKNVGHYAVLSSVVIGIIAMIIFAFFGLQKIISLVYTLPQDRFFKLTEEQEVPIVYSKYDLDVMKTYIVFSIFNFILVVLNSYWTLKQPKQVLI